MAPGLKDTDPGCGRMRLGERSRQGSWPALAAARASGGLMSWGQRLPAGAVWAWCALLRTALSMGSRGEA